jgi:hypothetical protein
VDRRAFEICEVGNVDAAVADAAGDHDRPRDDPLVVRESELEARRPAIPTTSQANDPSGIAISAPNFRLIERGPSTPSPRFRWKAHVVLDPRRCARLTAERAGIKAMTESSDAAYRGREAARSRADDGDVVNAVRSIGRTSPMHRASSTSLGLCRAVPGAQRSAAHDSMLKRSTSVFAHESAPGSSGRAARCATGSPESQHVRVCGAAHADRDAALKQTRRRISAHDALAGSASATRTSRSLGDDTMSLDRLTRAHRRATDGPG